MEIKKYNYTIGILSCIGILCVVMGHMGCGLLNIDGWFYYYSFHMPLFVFISGYFYNDKSTENVIGYIGKKVKRLILPFYVTALIYILLQTVLAIRGFNLGLKFSIYNWLIYPWLHDQSPGFNISCWFMLALFLVNVIYVVIRRCINTSEKSEKKWDIILLLAYMIMTMIIVDFTGDYNINKFGIVVLRSLFLISFYHMGYCYGKYLERKDNLSNVYYFIICLILRFFIIMKYGSSGYGVYNMSFKMPGYIVILITMLGIAFWLRIAKILTPIFSQSRLIIYVGQHTMDIMMHHLFAVFIIQMIFYRLYRHMGWFPGFDATAFKNNVYYLYTPIEQARLLYSIYSIGIVLAGTYWKDKILIVVKNSLR